MSGFGGRGGSVAHERLAWWRGGPRLSCWRAEAAATGGLTLLLLAMAALNGFPLLFDDTGAYMFQGFSLMPSPDRSAVYSLFLRFAGGKASLWYVAGLQCLISAITLVEFARAVRPRTTLISLLGVGLVLTFLTSAAWVAGQIEPDFLTPVLVLALYPLAFHAKRLGAVRTVLLMAIGILATAGHPSHLGLAAGLVLALVALRAAAHFRPWLPRPNVVLPVVCCGLGLGLLLAANHALNHRYFVSRSGPYFFAARLLADGPAVRTLDEICPRQRLRLCPYRHDIPQNADAFLWHGDTAFDKTGRFYAPIGEYQLLVRETLLRHPLGVAAGLMVQGVGQFFMIASGDGFQPVQKTAGSSFAIHAPNQMAAYLAARQQRGEWNFALINVVQVPVALAALWWLFASLRYRFGRRRKHAVLAAWLLLALIGNAAICGMISGAHNRYQSRLVWIVPFALLLTEPRAATRLVAWPARAERAVAD
jgi:hypothetical protein